jgi:hypothetical protein
MEKKKLSMMVATAAGAAGRTGCSSPLRNRVGEFCVLRV